VHRHGHPDSPVPPAAAAAGSGPHHGHSHHRHDHGHGHDATRAFALAVAINLGYTVLEAGFGFASHSLALLSDALHNLGDVLGLALAWGAARLAQRKPTARHTYGWRRATQLSPLANAVLLVGFSGALLGEALRRLGAPPPVPGTTVMWVAAIGIAVNLGTAALFHRDQAGDLNRRGAYLHLLADAGVSLAAVLAGLGMWKLGWRWLDPALAAAVALLVAWSGWGLLRAAFRQAMDAVPEHLQLDEVRAFLQSMPGVQAVHHLHIWPIGAAEIALTAHVVRADVAGHDAFLDEAAAALGARFGINHATLQVELGPGCAHDHDDPAPHH
jgi:cobalt-zinc-cadmium efflux system protein